MTNLQKRRKEAGLSQGGLAKASGVSVRVIQEYEQKRRDINRAEAIKLKALADVLNCKMEDLMDEI